MVCSIDTTANAVSGVRDVEYIVISQNIWSDVREVLQELGTAFCAHYELG